MMVLLLVLFLLANALLFAVPMMVVNVVTTRVAWLREANVTSLAVAVGWFIFEFSTVLVPFDLAFPWLLLGYSLIDTWLAGFAPVGGVQLVSLIALVVIIGVYEIGRTRAVSVILIGAPWICGGFLANINWTVPYDEVKVAMVQSNVTQSEKLLEALNPPEDRPQETSLIRHTRITADIQDEVDWIIWPESAIPVPSGDRTIDYLRQIVDHMEATLIVGTVLVEEYRHGDKKVYNSALALEQDSDVEQRYYKAKLVPFGEYIPFRLLFDWIGDALEIPFSILVPGRTGQEPFKLQEGVLGISICYEIAFPSLVVQQAYDAAILATISEDGWFGQSIGPHQHMQVARMRALETGKYLLRTTSSGITAIVDPKGKVINTVPQFAAHILIDNVPLVKGNTPYTKVSHSLAGTFFDHIFGVLFGSVAFFGILFQLLVAGRRETAKEEE